MRAEEESGASAPGGEARPHAAPGARAQPALPELVAPDDAPARAERRRRPLRALVLVALSLAAGYACSRLLARTPVWVADVEHRKLTWLAAHAAEPDTLVLGSSLVYRHVDPQILDAAFAERGERTHTLNLGMPGLSLAELWFLLDQIDAIGPPEVRRVLVSPPKTRVDLKENWGTVRSIQWHEPGPTWWALRLLVDEPEPWPAKLEFLWLHLADFLRNRSQIGAGWRALRDRFAGTAEDREQAVQLDALLLELLMGPHGDGFRSFGADWFKAEMKPAERRLLGQRRLEWEQGVQKLYEKELAERLAHGPPDVHPTPATEDFLEAMVARLRAKGWEPILFTQPLIVADEPLAQYAHLWKPKGTPPIVIDLSDPARDPELFAPGIHFDRQHLNHRGAKRLSELLAQRVVAALAERGR